MTSISQNSNKVPRRKNDGVRQLADEEDQRDREMQWTFAIGGCRTEADKLIRTAIMVLATTTTTTTPFISSGPLRFNSTTMSSHSLPPNVHLSTHPCLLAKLSQLRSKSTSSRETKDLIHEIALIIGVEALATGLSTTRKGTDTSPLGYEFEKDEVVPSLEEGKVSLMPILRSGLGMLDGACVYLCAVLCVLRRCAIGVDSGCGACAITRGCEA